MSGKRFQALLACLFTFMFQRPADCFQATVDASHAETIYHYSTERCDKDQIADAPVRAFRENKQQVRVILPSPKNRSLVGEDLDHLHVDCTVLLELRRSPKPSNFDDLGWIEALYQDGQSISALVSIDFHPQRHNLLCNDSKDPFGLACWYNAISTASSSNLSLFSFSASRPSESLVVAPNVPFSAMQKSNVGGFAASNVVRFKGDQFAMISVTAGVGTSSGDCLFRFDQSRRQWTAWDGKDFSIKYESPYLTNSFRSCKTLGIAHPPVRSLVRYQNNFLAVEVAPFGITYQVSSDLKTWGKEVVLAHLPIYQAGKKAAGEEAFYYPSVIDSKSSSPIFDDIKERPFLYVTRYVYGAGLNRDLVRFPIVIRDASEN